MYINIDKFSLWLHLGVTIMYTLCSAEKSLSDNNEMTTFSIDILSITSHNRQTNKQIFTIRFLLCKKYAMTNKVLQLAQHTFYENSHINFSVISI